MFISLLGQRRVTTPPAIHAPTKPPAWPTYAKLGHTTVVHMRWPPCESVPHLLRRTDHVPMPSNHPTILSEEIPLLPRTQSEQGTPPQFPLTLPAIEHRLYNLKIGPSARSGGSRWTPVSPAPRPPDLRNEIHLSPRVSYNIYIYDVTLELSSSRCHPICHQSIS